MTRESCTYNWTKDSVGLLWRSDGLYGADRVCELLNRVGCDQGAEGLLRSLLESVQAFAGSTRNQDDIAMVAIRFTP